ncbi:YbhB/YbcL family Raf kinase inhibitor-like protein [Altererythrobacter aurantiacus]|uniref:YbhB/YbcL family Raf kinase inhibitor-like protein n=1 Tax=Parapontixanthobacter aurantiacus TaxID=1463599 RepID=A0A844ZFL1_9SPHN|nr:YbhB/YbcL family Raf kinase inhibitor-like protein [Parapontixanthobacter aurantiacus]MXO85936.1 YbhB/YbcL family Raf kinase inhibitor-like protein [Parapontixanthobacter aurantiacus]
MTRPQPDWIVAAIGGKPTNGKLAIEELGEEKTYGRAGFSLSSPAFGNGDLLDPSFTAGEEDAVAPPLEWTAPPPTAQELVIIVEDGDGPADKDGNAQCHWLVWGLPGQKGMMLEGETPPRVGKNAKGNSEWLLPDPPEDDSAHRYIFQIFAVDLPLVELPGANRAQVLQSIRNSVVASALVVGKFAAVDNEDEGDWDDLDE